LSERHEYGIIAKSSVAEARFRSKISPRVYSSSRRRFVIDSSNGGGFGICEARCDETRFREAEFLCFPDPVRIGDTICNGELCWTGETFREGEPPGEPSFIC
jgi:hypothetical protein